ncbi:hypothetical protein M0R45_013545 [Rubus argutus]|uniref:Uncharacterized protein n=1 Tax=Rubus argutus TaxID=59490 RepID=A0AAW1XJ22_RUBAR
MIADSYNIAFRVLFSAEEAREEVLEDVPIVYDTRGEHSYIESHEEESSDIEFYSPSPSESPSPPQLLAVSGVPYKVLDGEAVWRYLTNKKESYRTLIMSNYAGAQQIREIRHY